jgi:hypothetical protein
MRIDSSGNLLVGKTTIATGTAGIALRSNGEVRGTADGDYAARFSRLSSDGAIVGFEKDGSVVGSIGSAASGADFYVSGSGSTSGVYFNGNGVLPCLGGSPSDGTEDLGQPDLRFRDLYLSGGVYLGGTGSANKLDDYESGTWTPSVSSGFTLDSTQTAVYRKIGDVVHVFGSITVDVTNGTEAVLAGLPFNCGAGNEPVIITFNNGSTLQYIPRARTDSSQPKLKFNPQVTASNVQIMIQATYRAS